MKINSVEMTVIILQKCFCLSGIPSIHMSFFSHFASNVLLFNENRTTENLCGKVKQMKKRMLEINDEKQVLSDKAMF